MKSLCIILISFLSISFSIEATAQKSTKKQIVLSAIKVTSKTTGFLSHINADAFLLEVSGIVRPAKGYKMIYQAASARIIIIGGSIRASKITKQDMVDVGGGVMFSCLGCDSCKVNPSEPGQKSYSCISGGCRTGCSSFLEIPTKNVLQYQTPDGDGGWQNL